MAESKLNKLVFVEAYHLASNKGYRNWVPHSKEIFKDHMHHQAHIRLTHIS